MSWQRHIGKTMPKDKKLDNSTFIQKRTLREQALARLAEGGVHEPIVLETHGGKGELFKACYAHLHGGVVFEHDPHKAAYLGLQRPTWAVYQCEVEQALWGRVGSHVAVDLLDVDPYGDGWHVIEAFFASERPFKDRMVIAVNDGLRQKLIVGAWDVAILKPMVLKYGNELHPIYLDVCRELLEEKVAQAGYAVDYFGGYYCGRNLHMTHFMAVLARM